jgi:3-dehydroquinate dehydratase I
MKIVASTNTGPQGKKFPGSSPDLIELRLDLCEGDGTNLAKTWTDYTDIPLILTLRSGEEGGLFPGAPDEWEKRIRPVLPFASYIDIEQRFSHFAPSIKDQGLIIVGSYHTPTMPSVRELKTVEQNLRAYCDIPKLVVTPKHYDDVLGFLSFTLHAEKPIITSIMGVDFRHIRLVLPFFGSEWIFGYMGKPTSSGQYHIDDLKTVFNIMSISKTVL